MKLSKSVLYGMWHSRKLNGPGWKVSRDGCIEIGTFIKGDLVSGIIELPDGCKDVIVRAYRRFIEFSISPDVVINVKIDEKFRLSKQLVKEFVKKKTVENLKQTD